MLPADTHNPSWVKNSTLQISTSQAIFVICSEKFVFTEPQVVNRVHHVKNDSSFHGSHTHVEICFWNLFQTYVRQILRLILVSELNISIPLGSHPDS